MSRRAASAVSKLLRTLFVFSLSISAWPQQASPQQSTSPSSQGSTSAAASSTQAATPAANQNLPEITSHEEMTTFQVKVNLVEVRVVVRDSKGKAIGGLKQEDFQLFDNGKPQAITRFTAERAGGKAPVPGGQVSADAEAIPPKAGAESVAPIPQNFIAYLFDDVHIKQADLSQARNAAKQQLAAMPPTDRAAIITTSGQTQLDFTDDRAKLDATLDRISLHPLGKSALTPCPNISYYMADLIINKHDQQATVMASQDALDCAYNDDQSKTTQAMALANSTAMEELTRNDDETRLALGVLNNVIRRMAALPGERLIVLISPGFLNPDEISEQSKLMESAVKAKVIINTLDVRGLYTDLPDISETRSPSAMIAGVVQRYDSQEAAENDDILADLAYTTGGTFFHNNNDLAGGFRELALPPEYSYILAFSPQNLKLDGRFHKLKVTLKAPGHLTVRARTGYYAPKGPNDSSEQAKQDIDDAVLSREEVRDIPIDLHTQYFKPDRADAKLSVIARVDVRHMHFRKDNGRNNNDVTVVSALFDRNGNFVAGTEKVLQLRLKDETLDGHLGSGVTLKSSFDVKPGSYVVRLVVRGQDGQMAAQNSSVEIP
jgi:VWFA-related protein